MIPDQVRTLFHYCCKESITAIRRDGFLRPHPHPLLVEKLVWLTDLDIPVRTALGLTSLTLTCDRTEYRVQVHTDEAVWWPLYARRVDKRTREQFDWAPGSMPAHWWVCNRILPVDAVTGGES